MQFIWLLFTAITVVPPWYIWGISWKVSLVVGGVLYLLFIASRYSHDSFKDQFIHFFVYALLIGGPLWWYGYGEWRFAIYGLVINVIGVIIIVLFSKWRKNLQFYDQYHRIQEEKRRQPGWTGKECLACGKPVPLSTKPGDYCPHCHKQFARELSD